LKIKTKILGLDGAGAVVERSSAASDESLLAKLTTSVVP
jgi:hypothetical protein